MLMLTRRRAQPADRPAGLPIATVPRAPEAHFPARSELLPVRALTRGSAVGRLVMHRARGSRREGGQANGSRKATVREAPEPKAATGSVHLSGPGGPLIN
jgi:hypothetical protein